MDRRRSVVRQVRPVVVGAEDRRHRIGHAIRNLQSDADRNEVARLNRRRVHFGVATADVDRTHLASDPMDSRIQESDQPALPDQETLFEVAHSHAPKHGFLHTRKTGLATESQRHKAEKNFFSVTLWPIPGSITLPSSPTGNLPAGRSSLRPARSSRATREP